MGKCGNNRNKKTENQALILKTKEQETRGKQLKRPHNSQNKKQERKRITYGPERATAIGMGNNLRALHIARMDPDSFEEVGTRRG